MVLDLRCHGLHMAAWQDCAQRLATREGSALPSTYSAEAIVKLNTAVPGSPAGGKEGQALPDRQGDRTLSDTPAPRRGTANLER